MSNHEQFNDIIDTLGLLENILLEAERCSKAGGANPQHVQIMFRYAHNAKGAFGMLQIEICQRLLHGFESMLDRARRGQAEVSHALIDAGLTAVGLLHRFAEGDVDTEAIVALTAQFDSMLASSQHTGQAQRTRSSFPLSRKAKGLLDAAQKKGARTYMLNKLIGTQISRESYESLPVFADITSAGAHIIATWPPHSEIDRSQDQAVLQILCASTLTAEEISGKVFDPIVETDFLPIVADETLLQKKTSSVPREPRILIVEDEMVSRRLLTHMLDPHGSCDVVVDGPEAILSFVMAIEEGCPYDMVFLDIRLPHLDGRTALRYLRRIEEERGLNIRHPSKVVMTTALDDPKNILGAFREGCEGYLVKPFDKQKFDEILAKIKPEHDK